MRGKRRSPGEKDREKGLQNASTFQPPLPSQLRSVWSKRSVDHFALGSQSCHFQCTVYIVVVTQHLLLLLGRSGRQHGGCQGFLSLHMYCWLSLEEGARGTTLHDKKNKTQINTPRLQKQRDVGGDATVDATCCKAIGCTPWGLGFRTPEAYL